MAATCGTFMPMIRTQIYIPKEMHDAIKTIARQEKKPQAEIVRRALEAGIKLAKPKETTGQALQRLIDLGKELNLKSDDPHLSTNIDKYLYEEWDRNEVTSK